MYELTVAFHYLRPRWRELAASIISVIAILVIALVVWLIVVFFSVTHGLEKSWLQKLVAVTAPARLTPTPAYYRSYYYLIDSVSSTSDYTLKSIGEKFSTANSDPYDPEYDGELPSDWHVAVRTPDNNLIDLVKEAFAAVNAISGIDGLRASEFEMSQVMLHLPLREGHGSLLTQEMIVAGLEPEHPLIAMLPPKAKFQSHDTVLLPKGFEDAGVKLGDRGWLGYAARTASAAHEQQLPIEVAGFYDPGIIPLGGKFLLGHRHLASLARASQQHEEIPESNGIQIAFNDLSQAELLKKKLKSELDKRGIAPYWKLETFRDYPYAGELLLQLSSERNLFTLLAGIIIAVACSNIVSMLIILVNDKKQEIGTLRALGATAFSIAAIFGCCGAAIGLIGSLVGIGVALLTLSHLSSIVSLLSALQGQELFNPLFYGDQLPTAVSGEALLFVVIATGVLSLLAGIIPALKTARAHPAALLRAE